jgi:hypothetical protein
MIKIQQYSSYTHRADGWIQDSSDFGNLHRFVSVFSVTSQYRDELFAVIKEHVAEPQRANFIKILNANPIIIGYTDIVGTSPSGGKSRKDSPCDGIGQAAVPGQKRDYIGDWPANNFLRWAHTLGFLEYLVERDAYQITPEGQKFADADDENARNKELLAAIGQYPPAIRILDLLDKNTGEPLTKFALGEKLGFIGEKGFTNISEDLFVRSYFYADVKDRKSMVSNREGSADKYARQICSWLIKLKAIVHVKKIFNHGSDKLELTGFTITPIGAEMLRKVQVTKKMRVPFGMLSMATNSEAQCLRRAYLLKAIEKPKTMTNIVAYVSSKGIETDESELMDDILSLLNIGLDISEKHDEYKLESKIVGLVIPETSAQISVSNADRQKAYVRRELKNLSHDLLVLIDYAYGGRASSLMFEIYVAKVYSELFEKTVHMGGPKRPDVFVPGKNISIIIDAKAYSKGFPFAQPERDKMQRYIQDYDEQLKGWYDDVKPDISDTAVPVFQFVSSFFKKPEKNIKEIAKRSGVNGSAISAESLLLLVDHYCSCGADKLDPELLGCNTEIIGMMLDCN